MKKLFGHAKPKTVKLPPSTPSPNDDQSIHTPIYHQHAAFTSPPAAIVHPVPQNLRKDSDDRWEVVAQSPDEPHLPQPPPLQPSRGPSFQSLPPGASPPVPSPLAPRSPSPFNILSGAPTPPPPPAKPPTNTIRERGLDQGTKKRSQGNVTLGILRALDPPTRTEAHPQSHPRPYTEEFLSQSDLGHGNYLPSTKDPGEKREKRSFWGRDKERDKPHDRERSERERTQTVSRDRRDEEPELTRMIGYLTATSSEDWGLVLEVCDRASSNETNAKEAVRALRREFKYGEPPAQLAAARLWAIMLRNSSELFISQSTTRKFLDTIADLLTSQKTSPVVRERLMNVVAAAAYASGNGNSKDGFRGLWRKVKPADKPDDGVPFDTEDAMFSPSVTSRVSQYDSESVITYPPAVPGDPVPGTPPGHKSPTRNRIIPPDEDIRRLFQECKIGRGNASLLSQALAMSRPEDLRKKDIVKEFYVKCRASQELIYAQIPWATAGAERSRVAKDQELQARRRTYSRESANGPEPPHELTLEEKLLDALLAANTELLAALQQYDDLERVAMERKAEQQSRKETRMDRKQLQLLENEGTFAGESRTVAIGGSSSSRSPSPSSQSQSYSPPPSITHPTYHPSDGSQSLMPPPAAPHGPRSPGHLSIHPRTPSPGTPNIENSSLPPHNDYDLQNGLSHLNINSKRSPDSDDAGEVRTAIKPSAKALGKRRLVEPDAKPVHNRSRDSLFASEDRSADDGLVDSDSDDSAGQWNQRINYVYDAAAERTQERIREGHNQLVNGVH